MFRVPWLVSYIQSSFTTTNMTSQNCRIPVPFILDLELIYLESESLSEFSLAFCTGCWHQKTEWEHILPVFSIHFILHCPADLQNTTSKIRWLTTQGSRILGSPTKHSVLLSTRPDMIAIQATNIWRYPRQEWMKIDPAPRPRAQLFTFFHQANNSFFHQQKASAFSITYWLEDSSSPSSTLKTLLLCVDWCLHFEDRPHLLMSPRPTDALP